MLLCSTAPLLGQGFAPYSQELLQERQQHWQTSLADHLRDVLIPQLRPDEYSALLGMELEVATADSHDPVAYQAVDPPPRIRMSATSIKFMDDLAVAMTWLSVHDYTSETVADYLAMVRYRRAAFPGGTVQDPLTALGIPSGSVREAAVDTLSLLFFSSAIQFAMAHEMGHLLYGIPPLTASFRQRQAAEAAADSFAVELHRRMHQPPLGLVLLMFVASRLGRHRGDFSSEAEWYEWQQDSSTHPLSGARVRQLAGALRRAPCDFVPSGRPCTAMVSALDTLDSLAALLDDEGIGRLAVVRANGLTLAALAPRRPNELMGSEGSIPFGPFSGRFGGDWVRDGTRLPMELVLMRDGSTVGGRFIYGLGEGWLSGSVRGDSLAFTWQLGGDHGRGSLRIAGARLDGVIGDDPSVNNRAQWSLVRR